LSKLIDRLKQLSEGAAPQPLGFHTRTTASSRPRIQLVASLSAEADNNEAIAAADAAFVRLWNVDAASDTVARLSATANVPWGARIEGNKAIDGKSIADAGIDFVVFPTKMALAGLIDSKIGRIIEIESTTSDTMLRALNSMPVEAVLMDHQHTNDPLAWEQLMLFQRLSGMVTKPTLVHVPATISSGELKALWEAKISAIVVDITAETVGAIKTLRQTIDALDYPTSRQRSTPLVPRLSLHPEQQEEQEEEDDD
jgi:hypothetical protein